MKAILTIAATLLASPALAKAPTWAKDCAEEGKKALALCEAITKDAGAADVVQAVANSAAVGSGAIINHGAQAGVSQGIGQTARLKTALTTCEKAELDCSKKCDQEEQDRMTHASGPPQNPLTTKAKAQAGQVIAAKTEACIAPLKALETKLAAGLKDALRATGEAANTRDATPMMPQMPQNQPKGGSGGGGDKDGDPTNTAGNPNALPKNDKIPVLLPKTTDCKSDPNAANLDQCKKDLVDTCTRTYSAGSSDSRCEGFTARYCNANPPAAESGSLMNPSASRPGEGIGSTYCNLAVSHDFCKEPARKDCMTCQNYRNFTAADCQLNSANCSQTTSQELAAQNCKDPEPPLSGSLFSGLTSPVAGASGGSGATVTASSGSEISPASAKDSAIAGEGSSELPKLSMETDGSGGGGSYSGQNVSDPTYLSLSGSDSAAVPAAARGPASAATASASTETAKSLSIFGIGTQVLEGMCTQNRLHHCRPGTKATGNP